MKIVIFAFNGISTFHLATPLLTFGEVSRQTLAEGWETVVWSEDGESVQSSDGILLGGIAGPDVVLSADILVFPSWPVDLREPSRRIAELIRRAHAAGALLIGLCLGAFPLVASGILNGRRVTTHWEAAELLALRYPAVDVQDDAIYIDHGDVLTSAGTASALDACLHVVRERVGSEAATMLARHLVIAPHRDGGQAQYIDRPLPTPVTGPIGETVTWALGNLDQRLSLEDLAEHARMSPRNLSRRFREVMGTTPAKWVLARRLDEACRLLESTSWNIDRVARACGFTNAITFRQNFVSRYSTTPTSYRRRFAPQRMTR